MLAAELLFFLLAAVTFVAIFDEISFTCSTTFELAKFSSEEDCAEDEHTKNIKYQIYVV